MEHEPTEEQLCATQSDAQTRKPLLHSKHRNRKKNLKRKINPSLNISAQNNYLQIEQSATSAGS